MMSKVYIKQILEEAKIDSDVVVRGWVRTKRQSKNVTFININDGTTIKTIQAVVEAESMSDEILAKRKGAFPRKISDSNFNLYIKVVANIS